MDVFDLQKRSQIMGKIGGKNTKPEIAVRSLLHRAGYRFRLHKSNLPGKPDIVLPKYKSVIFVHGCYWHRHNKCDRGRSVPSTNIEFWQEKFIKNKATLVEDVRRIIRSSIGNRAKESLLVDFINQTDLDKIGDKASIIDAFFAFAQEEQRREADELISSENLDVEAAKRYITTSIRREFASDNGTELNSILPKMSPLNPQYLTKKQSVLKKIAAFVEKFKGVGGEI